MHPAFDDQVQKVLETGRVVTDGKRFYNRDTMWSVSCGSVQMLVEDQDRPVKEILEMMGVYREPQHESHTALKFVDLGGR